MYWSLNQKGGQKLPPVPQLSETIEESPTENEDGDMENEDAKSEPAVDAESSEPPPDAESSEPPADAKEPS